MGGIIKIFTDFHHTDLFNSFLLLFEERLGYEVYRPIGMDWFNQGYWKIAEPYGNAMDTVKQFLEPGNAPADGTRPLNDDLSKTMTFQEFLEAKVDVIIGSIPAHWRVYRELRDRHKPKAKVVSHMGNRWEGVDFSVVENLLASTKEFSSPVAHNLFYHQEFDTQLFAPSPLATDIFIISSFLNAPQNYETYVLWQELKAKMTTCSFSEFGAQARDGDLDHQGIADWMKRSSFIWQVKPGGDGFGHIIHNAMSIGRIPIVRMSDYRDTLAGELLAPQETCLDVDGLSAQGIAELISQSRSRANEMGQELSRRFYDRVNYEEIAHKVERFILELV